MSLVRVEQTKGLREAFLVCRAELRERFDEVSREQQGAVTVNELATPLDASSRAKQLGLGHLKDPASLHVGEGALQRRKRLRRVCPAIFVRNDVGGLQPYAAVLYLHFKLSPLTDTQLPADIDRQGQTPLLIDRDDASCHLRSISDEVSLSQNSSPRLREPLARHIVSVDLASALDL